MNVPHETAIVNERTDYLQYLVVDVEIVLSVEVYRQLEHKRRVAAAHHKLSTQREQQRSFNTSNQKQIVPR